MSRISIFRIGSMTKLIVALSIMMLAEEGKLELFRPVSRYLPEFKDLKVGVEKKDQATGKAELVLETPSHHFPQKVWDSGKKGYKFRTPGLKRTKRESTPKGKS